MAPTLPPPAVQPLNTPVTAKAVLLVDGAVLLGENDRDEWELLGGRPEPGETLEQAVVREVQEEAGLRVVAEQRVLDEPFEVLPGRVVRVVAVRCRFAEVPPVLSRSDEHRRVSFVPLRDLAALRLPDVYRRAIGAA